MRAVYSILSPDELYDFVCERYRKLSLETCEYWQNAQSGGNDLYLVQSETRRYFLRVYLTGSSHEELTAQAQLCNDLYQEGIEVPRVFAADDGTLVQTIEAAEGTRYAVLSEFVEGRAPGAAITEAQSERYGQMLAAIHHVGDSKSYPLSQLDEVRLLDEPLKILKPFLPPARTYELIDLVDGLREKLKKLPKTLPRYGLCHGDAHKSNCLAHDELLTIIDFDCAAYSWRAYDLVVFRWSTGRPENAGGLEAGRAQAIWEAFLGGYQTNRLLTKPELDTITDFTVIRHIWWLAIDFWHIRSGRMGRSWVNDERFDFHFQILEHLQE